MCDYVKIKVRPGVFPASLSLLVSTSHCVGGLVCPPSSNIELIVQTRFKAPQLLSDELQQKLRPDRALIFFLSTPENNKLQTPLIHHRHHLLLCDRRRLNRKFKFYGNPTGAHEEFASDSLAFLPLLKEDEALCLRGQCVSVALIIRCDWSSGFRIMGESQDCSMG